METSKNTAHLLLVLQLPILLAADLLVSNVARQLADTCHRVRSSMFGDELGRQGCATAVRSQPGFWGRARASRDGVRCSSRASPESHDFADDGAPAVAASWFMSLKRSTAGDDAPLAKKSRMTRAAAPAGSALEIDEDLHSRQLAVYGRESMRRMAASNILIVGVAGLGVEIGAPAACSHVVLLLPPDVGCAS